jgi:hypothetical protein
LGLDEYEEECIDLQKNKIIAKRDYKLPIWLSLLDTKSHILYIALLNQTKLTNDSS